MSFDPETVDWTAEDNYFRCRNCGAFDMGHIQVGKDDWLTCDGCGTATSWGWNLTSGWNERTESEEAENAVALSRYRIAPEHQNTSEKSLEWGRASETPSRDG